MTDDHQLTEAQLRLKNKVLNSGRGITMEQAITRSSMAVKALEADFASIGDRDVGKMKEIVGKMQAKGADFPDLAGKLYDVAHELRGTAGTFGFKVSSVAANKLCQLIDKNRPLFDKGDMKAILAAKVHVDAIGLDLTHGPSNMIGEAENRMLDGLSALAKKIEAEAPADG